MAEMTFPEFVASAQIQALQRQRNQAMDAAALAEASTSAIQQVLQQREQELNTLRPKLADAEGELTALRGLVKTLEARLYGPEALAVVG